MISWEDVVKVVLKFDAQILKWEPFSVKNHLTHVLKSTGLLACTTQLSRTAILITDCVVCIIIYDDNTLIPPTRFHRLNMSVKWVFFLTICLQKGPVFWKS